MSYFATGAALTAALNALPASLTGTYKAFDAFYYAAQYMGNYTGTLTPIEHFVQIGAARGYQPNADFNPAFYQSQYSDLAGLDAADLLFHYVKFGLNEGRAGNATLAAYNWADYLAAYPAVADYVNANLSDFAGSTTNGAIAHYVKFGAQQGFTLPNNTVGQTFTLTASTDTVNGTAGNDTITGNQLTWADGDIIHGGAGTDTLVVVNTGAGSVAPAVMDGVENIQQTSTVSSAVNLVAAAGVEKVVSKNSTANDSFTNIQSAAVVEIDGSENAVVATFATSVAGAAKTANVTLKGGATVSELDIAAAGGTEFGTIAIASEGAEANTLTLIEDEGSAALAALATVNVTGAADLSLGTSTAAFAAAGTTINAAAATGDLAVNGTNFETITLGSGDDTLYLGSTQVSQTTAAAKVALNGGAGANTLVFGAQDLTAAGMLNGAAADADTIANFQTVTFTAANADGGTANTNTTRTIVADAFDGISTIVVNAANNDATASGTGNSEDVTVAISGLLSGQTVQASFKASASAGNDEYVTLAMASPTGDADQVTLESIAGTNTAVNSITTLTVSQTTVAGTAESVEQLNVVATRANVSSTVGTTIGAISAGYTTTLNISGAGNIAVGTVELLDSSTADTTVATVNASALTGNLTLGTSSADFQATDADDINLTLGSGTNAVYGLAALDDGDTITGTTGTDTVYITGGSGAVNLVNVDTVQYTSGNGTTTSAANWNVTTIDVTNSTLSSTITNIAAGQAIKSDDIDLNKQLTLNVATGVTALAVELNTADASAGTLATNATTVTINQTGVDANGDFADNALILGATPTTVNLQGGGETSTAGTYSAFTLSNSSSGLVAAVNSSYNGSVNVSGVYFDTVNGATVTTGATTVASTTTTKQSDIANGVVRFVDTAGTDTLAFTSTGGDLGFLDITGYETIAITDLDMGSAMTGNFRDVEGATKISIVGPTSGDLVEDITLSNIASGTTFAISGAWGDSTDEDIITLTARNGGTADTLVITTAGANLTSADADAGLTASGFETVTVAAGADNIDLLNTNKDMLLTLSGATTLLVGGDLVSAADDGDITLGTVAATSATSVELNSVGGSVAVTDLGTMNSLETLVLTAAESETTALGALSTSSLDLVTISGAGTVTISSMTGSSVDNIDASGATGSVTLGTSSAALTLAAGATVTGGDSADTVTIAATNLLNLALGDGTDTVYVVGAQNGGAGVIDLSSSTDQIVTFNGVAQSTTQTGINNINLSGVTSANSYGFSVTAAATGSTITGSAYADSIILGAASDVVVMSTATTADTITGFTLSGTGTIDKINVDALTTSTAFDATLSSNTTSGLTVADGDIYLVTSSSAGDADSTAAAATLISAREAWTDGGSATMYFVVTDNNSTGIFKFVAGGSGEVSSSELTLVGTVDAVLTASNFLFA